MPYKANESRHRIPKARYKIENRAEHDAALRRRGRLTVWGRLSLFGQPGVEFLDLPLSVSRSWSTRLTRMLGRCSASQIASASVRSFFRRST
jgi:hypothetical protein